MHAKGLRHSTSVGSPAGAGDSIFPTLQRWPDLSWNQWQGPDTCYTGRHDWSCHARLLPCFGTIVRSWRHGDRLCLIEAAASFDHRILDVSLSRSFRPFPAREMYRRASLPQHRPPNPRTCKPRSTMRPPPPAHRSRQSTRTGFIHTLVRSRPAYRSNHDQP